MTKEELLDEGRLQKECAQDLADAGMPPRQALVLGKWLAQIACEQFKISDLLSWLTVYAITNHVASVPARGMDELRKSLPLLTSLREGSQQYVLEAFATLRSHHDLSELIEFIAARRWDDVMNHVRMHVALNRMMKD